MEFAIIGSVLLVLLLVIVQLGALFHTRMALQAAAREGGRLAALAGVTSEDIDSQVRRSLGEIDPGAEECPASTGRYCVEITPPAAEPCASRSGQDVSVEVTTRARVDLVFWASDELTILGRGVFRCE